MESTKDLNLRVESKEKEIVEFDRRFG